MGSKIAAIVSLGVLELIPASRAQDRMSEERQGEGYCSEAHALVM